MTPADGFVSEVVGQLPLYAALWVSAVIVPALGALVLVLALRRAADAS